MYVPIKQRPSPAVTRPPRAEYCSHEVARILLSLDPEHQLARQRRPPAGRAVPRPRLRFRSVPCPGTGPGRRPPRVACWSPGVARRRPHEYIAV